MANSTVGSDGDDSNCDSDSENFSTSSAESDLEIGDFDHDEYRRRRDQLVKQMSALSSQYAILREQLHTEKMRHIEKLLELLQCESALEYKKPLEELQREKQNRIQVAEALRNFRLKTIDISYAAEKRAIDQDKNNEESLFFDKMKEKIEGQIKKLEEAKNMAEYPSYEQLLEKSRLRMQRKRKAEEFRRKPVTAKFPYVVYQLDEDSILEDWATIKKSLQLKRCVQKGSG